MWKSYHIYEVTYDEFLKKVEYLKNKCFKESDQLFFTIYRDFKGPHFRLRINSKSNREKAIHKELIHLFSKHYIEERIYDPEYIKYGKNLEAYERFSTIISNYIVNNRIEFQNKIKALNSLLGIIKTILEKFEVYDLTQIERSMKFWKNSKKFFNLTITQQIYVEIMSDPYMPESISESVNNLFKEIIINSVEDARKLCFNFIHLTVNRFNFNLKDECILYYKLYELKGEQLDG